MLEDRPAMQALTCVDGSDYVLTEDMLPIRWAAKHFNGHGLLNHIRWNPQFIRVPTTAQHLAPRHKTAGYIQVMPHDTDGSARTSEQMWAGVIFELHNIQYSYRQAELWHMANTGELSRSQWIRRAVECEYNAALETAAFYYQHWKPWAEIRGIKTTPREWFTKLPADFDTYYKYLLLADGDYPLKFYGPYYDLMQLNQAVQPNARKK